MLSRSSLHAVQAMARLALLDAGEFIGAASLAETMGAPGNYLGKLLQGMAGRGLVQSRRGLGGGFRLAREPGRITLLEIVDPIDDLTAWNGCLLRRAPCPPENPCALHDTWAGLRETYLNLLSLTTVAQIASTWETQDREQTP